MADDFTELLQAHSAGLLTGPEAKERLHQIRPQWFEAESPFGPIKRFYVAHGKFTSEVRGIDGRVRAVFHGGSRTRDANGYCALLNGEVTQ